MTGRRLDFGRLGLRDRMPMIPIALGVRSSATPELDVQEALIHVYEVFGYEDYIYSGLHDPLLEVEDQAWAQSLIPRLQAYTLQWNTSQSA